MFFFSLGRHCLASAHRRDRVVGERKSAPAGILRLPIRRTVPLALGRTARTACAVVSAENGKRSCIHQARDYNRGIMWQR